MAELDYVGFGAGFRVLGYLIDAGFRQVQVYSGPLSTQLLIALRLAVRMCSYTKVLEGVRRCLPTCIVNSRIGDIKPGIYLPSFKRGKAYPVSLH